MGVHGLWQLLQSAGRPVSLESLEGKILAVDVSIWLHQTMKGMRDKDGNPLPNAHLQGLFSRVCKLLYYRIKPVFVFDGGVPVLKRQTMIARKERKAEAERESNDIAQKLLLNLVQSNAVKQALGESGKTKRVPGVQRGRNQDRDIFELAPLPESEEIGLTMNAEQWEKDFEQQENWIREGLAVLSDANPDSEEFRSLPMEIQHEILHEIKEQKKYHSLRTLTKMPEDSDSFSSYQLKKLMKQSKLTNRIEEVRKEMSSKTAGDISYSLGDDYYGDEVEARRIVSDDATHYVLIKGLTKRKQEEEAEKYELENKVKLEKEEEEEVMEGSSCGVVTKDQKSSQAASKKCFSDSDSDLETLMARRQQQKKWKKKTTAKKPGSIQTISKNSNIQPSYKISSIEKTDCLKVLLSAHGNDEINERDSSSEDEGFIEVTIDPNAVAEEDELFPASIFAKSEDPGKNLLASANLHHHTREEEPVSHEMSVPVTSAVVTTDDEVLAKRKSLLNDILSQLAEKKKSLTAYLSDSKLDNDDVQIEAVVIDGGSNLSKWVHEEDNKTKVSAPNGDVDAELDPNPPAAELDFNTSGGFIREESFTDEDGYGVSTIYSNKVNILTPLSGHAMHSTTQKSENLKTNQKASHELSDSDDDMKLAIQLSLQTAKTEQAAANKSSPAVMGDDGVSAMSPMPVVTESGAQISKVAEGDLSNSQSDSSSEFEDIQQFVTSINHEKPASKLSFQLDKELKDLEENDSVVEEEIKDRKDEASASREPQTAINTSGSLLSTESPSKLVNRPQPEDFEEDEMDIYFHNLNEDMLMDLNTDLDTERATLLSEQGKQNRLATSVTEQINMEAQELLRLFGIPYIVSPMEAEAQCAYLDITDQTQGTITDDSDIWLFGGRRMYKNFFNQSKHVELFTFDNIYNHFGLNREQLINMALLCGSDYTEGIQGVGPVRALEIMAEFPGDGLEGLCLFRKWWDMARKKEKLASGNKVREHLKDLKLIPGFPSEAVVDAYLNPTVDDSKERFRWSSPELGLLREFAKKKFGWPKEKADQTLLPMMKQFNKKETQGRISAYFQPENFIQVSKIKSQRLKKALDLVKNPNLVKNPKTVNRDDSDKDNITADSESEDSDPVQMKKRKTGTSGGNESRELQAIKKSQQQAESDEDKAMKNRKVGKGTKGKSKTGTRGRHVSDKPVEEVGSEVMPVQNDSTDSFMEVMSKKVKNVSALLEQKKVRGRGGRGGNSMGKRTAVGIYKMPLSLDQVCPQIGRKMKSGVTRRGMMGRGVVNLSESSSSESEEGESKRRTISQGQKDQVEKHNLGSNKKQAVTLQETENVDEGQRSKLQQKPNVFISCVKVSMNQVLQVNSMKRQITDLEKETHLTNKDKNQEKLTNRSAQSAVPEKETSLSLSETKGNCTARNRDSKADVLVNKTRKPAALTEFYHNMAAETSTEGEEIDISRADVSVINKKNLPETLAYLNRRTKQDRFLLQQLKGHQPSNIVERRLEEHEKRRLEEHNKRRVEELDKRRVDSQVKEKKEKSSMSFEDLLGGMDRVVPEKKKKLLNLTSPIKNATRSTEDKLTAMKNQMVMQDLTSGVDECGQTLKFQNNSRQNYKGITAEDAEEGIANIFARRTVVKEDKKNLAMQEESFPGRTYKTRKAVNFDQPISTSDDEDSHAKKLSRKNKFKKQMQHLGDVQSIRGHGILPCQPRGDLVMGSRAFVGKGKGRGKNRSDKVGDFDKKSKSIEGGETTNNANFLEYSKITADDLGSDFSDCEF